ncbi:5-methylcytosine restriction system specificity protein McrC [Brevibacterium aurantiacum]|uniref:5-methylcytosine restriction system specificity protein McrC n=1 Tax=Brevibacterium aurantiacum TaxID=273384 RepID=UPI0011446CA0|nr:hypothetical protein [Brevibacterium aurantiacum]
MSRITVREYAKDQWIPNDGSFETRIQEVAVELKSRLRTRQLPLEITGRRIHRGESELRLAVREVTGVIPIGQAVIEIQPKFLASADSEGSWREGLLAVLAHIRGLDSLPRVVGGLVPDSFVDLIGVAVASGLAQAVHDGMPRRYLQQSEDSSVFRGQLDVNRAWRIYLDPTRIPIIYDEFSADTPAVRLLLWAATRLRHSVISKALGSQLEHLSTLWHDIPADKPTASEIETITLPIQYSFLDNAIRAAKILASGDFLGLSATEQQDSFGFVWKTETVFEDFVRAVCSVAAGYIGADANKLEIPVLLNPTDTSPSFRQEASIAVGGEPDVVVHRRGATLAILDAKYKRLGRMTKDTPGAPSAADVYQVCYYAAQAKLDKVALVYPAQSTFTQSRRWPVAWPEGSASTKQPQSIYAFSVNLAWMAGAGGFERLVQEMRQNLATLMS